MMSRFPGQRDNQIRYRIKRARDIGHCRSIPTADSTFEGLRSKSSFVKGIRQLNSPSMLGRRTTASEDFEFLSHCDLTLAFELQDKSVVSQVLDKLDRSVVGLHLKYVLATSRQYHGLSLAPASKPSPCPPARGRMASYPLSCPIWRKLGNFGFIDPKVILNIIHAFSEGRYFKRLTDHIFDAISRDPPTIPSMLE
jgi:hypothetical protein